MSDPNRFVGQCIAETPCHRSSNAPTTVYALSDTSYVDGKTND